jgi:hypothetical protein
MHLKHKPPMRPTNCPFGHPFILNILKDSGSTITICRELLLVVITMKDIMFLYIQLQSPPEWWCWDEELWIQPQCFPCCVWEQKEDYYFLVVEPAFLWEKNSVRGFDVSALAKRLFIFFPGVGTLLQTIYQWQHHWHMDTHTRCGLTWDEVLVNLNLLFG